MSLDEQFAQLEATATDDDGFRELSEEFGRSEEAAAAEEAEEAAAAEGLRGQAPRGRGVAGSRSRRPSSEMLRGILSLSLPYAGVIESPARPAVLGPSGSPRENYGVLMESFISTPRC